MIKRRRFLKITASGAALSPWLAQWATAAAEQKGPNEGKWYGNICVTGNTPSLSWVNEVW